MNLHTRKKNIKWRNGENRVKCSHESTIRGVHNQRVNIIFFANFLTLAFRICAIYTHVSEFYIRDNIFNRTVILNHPADWPERETPKTRGGFRFSIFTRKPRAEDESTESHADTSGVPVAVC